MRSSPPLIATSLALLILAVTGCSETTNGTAAPSGAPQSDPTTTPPESGDSSALPGFGAPPVENALNDTERFQDDPCSVLTAEQLGQLGVPKEGEKRNGSTGSACRWYEQDTSASVDIEWVKANQRGLTGAYANRDNYELFVEMPPIDGNPVLAYGDDTRDLGDCQVLVGATDELVFQTAIGQSRSKVGTTDPCEVAHTVAGMMLETMRGGS
ncbi:DUF3558 domain-containing protein [Qaidamihabitans albus]|uniref:DUF3558 domain-containing protein n=1 Tax=Qaidamihabitans albus TaxID=2795733 RepID=UPI0018F23F41|nr:DUF3558 domain-containing protein [Qaidamihabitans albus]